MRKFNLRAVVSISLFLLLMILFITAIGLEILEDAIAPDLVELHGIFTGIHIVSGLLFCSLSIIHIIKNFKVLKSYLRKN
jgi:hypothetical protein